MIEYFINDAAGRLLPVDQPQKNCWINVERPTHADIQMLASNYNIPASYISAVLDNREKARVDGIDPLRPQSALHLLLQFPRSQTSPLGYLTYATYPISFVLTDSAVITISNEPAAFIHDFIMSGDQTAIKISDRQDFVLRFGWYVAHSFVKALSDTEVATRSLERQLTTATHNDQLYKIMAMQKALTVFTSALTDNRPVLDQISAAPDYFNGPKFQELLSQIIIETEQAQTMASIQSDILGQFSNMVSAVVSNNLNEVMKLLTSITLVMTIPTIIGGIYGMNVGLPFAHLAHAFSLIMGVTIVICIATAMTLRRHDWF
ncbi:magnesium transporter CorA family protein [Furfurilactobacillus siliginis]|uniref:Magnesium transporter n=1 Tax=Furfurilactobacillus siliginis TaxID=348151 RepID=A0A0R2LBS3_9LACO|nr:magnesium transporter CorA family protein [Furfurilactobacillus siliginis]KRN96109.1 Mg2+ and Co2+ transport protein [Furfurilactobacillus siliginis]GEK27967.1 magnesium transporter [Furfurilactobacillus siliginis]